MRAAAIAALALAGCAAGQLAAPGTAEARLGEIARLGDLAVRPLAVIEDSRCPRDVTCVWAGRLRLGAAVGGVPAELVLGEPFALPGGGTITLVAATPEPWQNPPPGVEGRPASRFAFRRD